jgi:ssDNA-binding Zn-finger/Zn-ribbon topoisomerase 1
METVTRSFGEGGSCPKSERVKRTLRKRNRYMGRRTRGNFRCPLGQTQVVKMRLLFAGFPGLHPLESPRPEGCELGASSVGVNKILRRVPGGKMEDHGCELWPSKEQGFYNEVTPMNSIHTSAKATSRTPHVQSLPGINVHRCPSCGSIEVHAVARTGLFEHVTLWLKMEGPFLCYECGHRFYDSVFT